MRHKILPEGIETGDYCCVDDIHFIPKNCSYHEYISYDEDDYEKQFRESGNDSSQLQKGNRIVIENPIYKMSRQDILDEIIQCIDYQPDDWKQKYLNKVAEDYNFVSSFETNLDGQPADYQCKAIVDRFKKLYNMEPTVEYNGNKKSLFKLFGKKLKANN